MKTHQPIMGLPLRNCLHVLGAMTFFYLSLVTFFLHPFSSLRSSEANTLPITLGTLAWMLGQWSPSIWSQSLSEVGWSSFEQLTTTHVPINPLDIPTLDLTVATIRSDPLKHLIQTYGADWISRPLLLKGVWSREELLDPNRRLSIPGLARDTLVLHYFSDARKLVLTPDSEASLAQILKGIRNGMPHKIGSQEYFKAYPDRLTEVAPTHLVSTLFGDRFTRDRLLGHIHNPMALIQGPLTVPIFVANAKVKSCGNDIKKDADTATTTSTCLADQHATGTGTSTTTARPFTGLHCEPIGNVSVQLAGAREWTLVQPEYWKWLRPTVSPDGRGFFASWAPAIDHVPRYRLRTLPGDAVWVPPWTWHRVDYVVEDKNRNEVEKDSDFDETDEANGRSRITCSATPDSTSSDDDLQDSTVALGASLFHFRPLDFVRRNPIYALILAPYLLGELLGTKTQ
jgi:hypothetical protein